MKTVIPWNEMRWDEGDPKDGKKYALIAYMYHKLHAFIQYK